MPNSQERLTEDFQRDVRQFWDGFKQESYTFLRRAPGTHHFLGPMMDHAEQVFERVAQKPLRILEIGCGDGFDTIGLARRGHEVYAVDVSTARLERAQKYIDEAGVGDKARLIACRAENMPFSDEFFDLVYCNSVLLYTDADTVLRECNRVLKRGGKTLFVNESLAKHPLIWLVRHTTGGNVRKDMERLVKRIDPEDVRRRHTGLYSKVEHHEFFLVSPFALSTVSVLAKLGLAGDPFHRDYGPVHRLDRALLSRLPALRRYCWVSTLVCTK